MTILEVVLTVPAADGAQVPAEGVLRFKPTRRRTLGGTTVLPKPFAVPLTAGTARVDLAPNDSTVWVWRIDERVLGTPTRTIYATVPDTATVNYSDLVAIDPDTLAPAAELTPAWVANFDALVEQVNNTQALQADPANPGFYLVPQYSPLTADPDNSGFYLTGV